MVSSRLKIFAAKALSLFTLVGSLKAVVTLLFRYSENRLSQYGFMPEHLYLRLIIQLIDGCILIAASIYLWKRYKEALYLFMVDTVIALFSGLYLAFLSPDPWMRSFQHSLMFIPTIACGVVFLILRLAAVWWLVANSEFKDSVSTYHAA